MQIAQQGDYRSKSARKLNIWVAKHLNHKQFMILLSLLVGAGAAIAAQILKLLIHEIEHLLTSQLDITRANWLFATMRMNLQNKQDFARVPL